MNEEYERPLDSTRDNTLVELSRVLMTNGDAGLVEGMFMIPLIVIVIYLLVKSVKKR